MMNGEKMLEFFERRVDAIVDEIVELVEIESPSFDFERSREVGAWIERRTSEIGLDLQIERTSAENLGEHVTIRAFPGDAKSCLVLGHTDTVHPVGTKQLNPTRIEDGRLYGCGVFDMKANIVLLLEALRFFAETGVRPNGPITALFTCDEEVGSATGRTLVEREAGHAELCLVLEPSAAGRVKTGRKGTAMYTVKAWGKPAHAGLEPEKGASAILELARQIETITSLNDNSAGTSVNVCTIKGGTTTNVIPEHAECTVDVRFTSAAEAEKIDSRMRALEAFDPRVKLLTSGGVNRPQMERTAAVADLYARARERAAAFGYDLGETQVGGASDGNFVAALGVPVLDGLGATGDGAHTLGEYICVGDIARRATLLTMMLAGEH